MQTKKQMLKLIGLSYLLATLFCICVSTALASQLPDAKSKQRLLGKTYTVNANLTRYHATRFKNHASLPRARKGFVPVSIFVLGNYAVSKTKRNSLYPVTGKPATGQVGINFIYRTVYFGSLYFRYGQPRGAGSVLYDNFNFPYNALIRRHLYSIGGVFGRIFAPMLSAGVAASAGWGTGKTTYVDQSGAAANKTSRETDQAYYLSPFVRLFMPLFTPRLHLVVTPGFSFFWLCAHNKDFPGATPPPSKFTTRSITFFSQFLLRYRLSSALLVHFGLTPIAVISQKLTTNAAKLPEGQLYINVGPELWMGRRASFVFDYSHGVVNRNYNNNSYTLVANFYFAR